MSTLPDHSVESVSIERKCGMEISVSGQADTSERYGSRRTFNPTYVHLSFRQDGPDTPVYLWGVTLRGPRRLKDGKLSGTSTVQSRSSFWKIEADELEELDFSFPEWVRALVEEYWPATI
jgi:hypothetical protein